MAGMNALNEHEIGMKLEEIDQKIKHGRIDEAIALSRPLYAKASADLAVQMVMKNLSEITQRANDVLAQLDDCHGKLNWEQIHSYKREIEILHCNHKLKNVIFVKIADLIERYNQITADALDTALENKWSKAEERVRDAEMMDPNGMRSRRLRAFCDGFKKWCSAKGLSDHDCRQALRLWCTKFGYYRFSQKSPVYVTWPINR